MFSGPMFRHERQIVARGRRPFVFRIVLTVMLGLIAGLIGLVLYSAKSGDDTPTRLLYFGRALVIATFVVELLFFSIFVPAHVAGAIAGERQKDTLSLLLLTRLRPVEIVLTKVLARWLPAAQAVVVGLPFLAAGAWSAGLEREAALAAMVLLSSSAFMATLAILASARRELTDTARGEGMLWAIGWLVVPAFVTIMPVRTGSLWGDLLDELKNLAALIAPSSPLSLATDPGWFNGTGTLGLEGRVALMIGLQAVFGGLAVALASGRLKAREKNPNWIDPTRGHRPACGDDPVFWREYELPTRRGGGSPMVIQLRYVWILIRAILISLLTLLAVLVALAVPIGLLVATIYYGLAAFRELAAQGSGPSSPFADRAHFNMLIRAATGLLGLLPAISVASLVAGRIVTERDKKTWDAFLTTPLSGEEILRSKARVAVTSLIRHAAWPLPILWLLGLACGVLTPLGVALTAVDLAMATWALVTLGLYFGLRPGPTKVATNRSSWLMLAFMAIHGPLLFAALATPRELALFANVDAKPAMGRDPRRPGGPDRDGPARLDGHPPDIREVRRVGRSAHSDC